MGVVKAPGIRPTKSGWQVFVRVNGKFLQKHYPHGTDMATLKAKRAELHAYGVLEQDPPKSADGTTFAQDCATYLKAVDGMPTIKDRTSQIEAWKSVFGRRVRSTITPVEIQTVLSRWAKSGPYGTPLAPGTRNRYRTALGHLWRTLDGRDAYNPIRGIDRLPEPELVLTLPTIAQMDRVFAHIGGMSRLRLEVLRWTGWAPAVMTRVREQDINWRRREVRLHPRRKGHGTPAVVGKLLPQGAAALKSLVAANGLGPYSHSSLWRSVQRACKTAGVRPFRVYDLRHWFLTALAKATKDKRAVKEIGMHTSDKTSDRYSRQAASVRVQKALATFATQLGRSGLVGPRKKAPTRTKRRSSAA